MRFFDGLAKLIILFVRGILLWVLVPAAIIRWIAVHWWAQKATIAQAVSWYDLNLWAILMNGPFRPMIMAGTHPAILPFSLMKDVVPHKVGPLDLW